MTEKKTGLDLLREPFPDNQVSKLPKGTKKQNECPAEEKVNCKECGGWHHPRIIHLDYVGHAALTDRLLDADPLWSWEPIALRDGLPAFDSTGGLWIKLTVCGHTRIGYGHAASSSFKEIGSREKEVIGDALRNAAMRFGAALDLWHKGELHVDEIPDEKPTPKPSPPAPVSATGENAAPDEKPKLATPGQVQQIQIIMKKRGFKDRDKALEDFTSFCGRQIKSSKEMTFDEAHDFIEANMNKAQAA